MALSGLTFDPVQAYGKEYKLLALKITVGAAGAVGSVDGKGWKSTGAAGVHPNNGSVVKETAAGQYSITLPGTGSVHDILLLSVYVEDASDILLWRVEALSTADRKITLQALNADTPAATNPSNGTILHVALLVKNSNID